MKNFKTVLPEIYIVVIDYKTNGNYYSGFKCSSDEYMNEYHYIFKTCEIYVKLNLEQNQLELYFNFKNNDICKFEIKIPIENINSENDILIHIKEKLSYIIKNYQKMLITLDN
jgi:hypothetical protein